MQLLSTSTICWFCYCPELLKAVNKDGACSVSDVFFSLIQFYFRYRLAQTFMDHQLHTNTKEFIQVCLPFFHETLIITQILTTTNQIMLSKMHYFLHFHGPHSITSLTHYQSHYIITQMITSYVKLGYIISLHHFMN